MACRRSCLIALAVVVGWAAPTLANEPFTELVLPEQVDSVRAAQRSETLHVVYAKDKRCLYRRGKPGSLGAPLPPCFPLRLPAGGFLRIRGNE